MHCLWSLGSVPTLKQLPPECSPAALLEAQLAFREKSCDGLKVKELQQVPHQRCPPPRPPPPAAAVAAATATATTTIQRGQCI
jgi:hypothetical protein